MPVLRSRPEIVALFLSLFVCAPPVVCADPAPLAEPLGGHTEVARPNGRQIVRPGGRWLTVTPDPSGERAWFALSTGKPSVTLAEWENVLFLSADDRGLFRSTGRCS